MSEEENIKERPEDGKTGSPEDGNWVEIKNNRV
jgi:hypothetical protein